MKGIIGELKLTFFLLSFLFVQSFIYLQTNFVIPYWSVSTWAILSLYQTTDLKTISSTELPHYIFLKLNDVSCYPSMQQPQDLD